MLMEKYDPVNLFDLFPLERDPVLDEIDRVLDEEPEFLQDIKTDLARRHPHSLTLGRPSTPIEVIKRMLLVKHLYNWSYEETEKFVADSIVLRQFCRVYLNKVPDDTVLIRWAELIRPETMHRMVERVILVGRRKKVIRGRKLRTDGTVVESNVHYPTDSSLLEDGVRVLGRTLRRARQVVQAAADKVGEVSQRVFRNRLRSARNTAQQIRQITRGKKGQPSERCRKAYRKLVQISQASVQQAYQVGQLLQQVATAEAQRLAATLEHFAPLVERVIDQTVRRVFQEEKVSAKEKLVSLFEPHTAIIRRGRAGRPTEFGRKIWLDEVDGRIVSNYRILEGNPKDESQWIPSLQHHHDTFARPPNQASGDRGLYSRANELFAEQMGVKRVILPKSGYRSQKRQQHEQQGWFRRGRHYHCGVEGRISYLKRKFGLDRCLYHGDNGFERWIGWGIIAHNLRVIGTALAD